MLATETFPHKEVEIVLSVVCFHLGLCSSHPQSKEYVKVDSLIKNNFGKETKALTWCKEDLSTLGKIVLALVRDLSGVFTKIDLSTKLQMRSKLAEKDEFFRKNIDVILPIFGEKK